METLKQTSRTETDRVQAELLAVHHALGERAVYGLGSELIEIDKSVIRTFYQPSGHTQQDNSRFWADNSSVDRLLLESILDVRMIA